MWLCVVIATKGDTLYRRRHQYKVSLCLSTLILQSEERTGKKLDNERFTLQRETKQAVGSEMSRARYVSSRAFAEFSQPSSFEALR